MGRNEPPDVTVLGAEPYYLGWSMELSRPVADALPFLVEAVKREISVPLRIASRRPQ